MEGNMDMEAHKEWWIEERSKKAVEKLKAHDFKALFVKTKEEAAQEIRKHILPGQTVGVGGSLTIRNLGILDGLEAQGNKVLDHWKPGLSKEEIFGIRKSQLVCELFLSSANALTMNGEFINIDGVGNRVNATVFGPGKVILVIGYQKIVEDIQAGLHRIKNVAAPLNAKRLNIDVPCAKLGKCVDCNSPNRICRVVVIHERKPMLTDMLVILVGEELGY
jgi:hypothetical protein